MDCSNHGLVKAKGVVKQSFGIKARFNFLLEFGGRLLGEGCQYNLFRFHQRVFDEVGEPLGQGIGFAAAGAGAYICYVLHLRYLLKRL